ncbi:MULTISPECIES: holin family protein [Sediminimonas]|uniref:holin family protein n=1 Tax=Sediminimonas TaxID=659427 RepID=UPI000421BEAB|nr:MULTISPECIES: holin family protein [Sediminimonas]MDR9486274.1 holin family protein [Sediminimonas sp.]
MGLIEAIVRILFGSGRNVLRETAHVFRPGADAMAARDAARAQAALAQFEAEFTAPRRGRFDRVMDALNRVPRPAMALGTLALFAAAMFDPTWFAARMAGLAMVPEPLWWLMGAIVSFYFGARYQAKGHDFRRSLRMGQAAMREFAGAEEAARGPGSPAAADSGPDAALTLQALRPDTNPALSDWRRRAGR